MHGNSVKKDGKNGQLNCGMYSSLAADGILCKVGSAIAGSRTGPNIRIQIFFFSGFLEKKVLENVVRKLLVKFHRASLIRKCFQIGGTKSLTKKQKI